MDLISKCKKDLREIIKCKSIKERRQCLNSFKNCVIDSISEICDNFLRGNIPIKNFNISKLKRFRKYIEFLSQKKPYYKRRKIIVQKGGFLNFLIPSALYLLEKVLN